LLVVVILMSGLLACNDDRSSSSNGSASDSISGNPTPFTGEQLDRIDAGVRAQAPPSDASDSASDDAPDDVSDKASGKASDEPPSDPRPLWITNELRDDRMRLVIHVRLPVAGNLDNLERNQQRCADVRARMREFLLPGQRVELYLVFDDSVHACRDE